MTESGARRRRPRYQAWQETAAGAGGHGYNPDGWVIDASISNNVGHEYFPVSSTVSCSPR